VLEDAYHKLELAEILEHWPGDHEAPSRPTLQRLLDKARTRALVCRDGAGRRHDAYRYWLPQKEAQFQSDLRCQLDDLHRAQMAALDPAVRRRAELESAMWNTEREAEEQAEE
jgi:hypothetical protein